MSTQPPNMPPYGQQPGHDPRDWARQQKEYWRAQKEQNRAYWKANREQWKAQREQWRTYYGYRTQRRSVLTPILLILIGVVALLVLSGHIDGWHFWSWYGRWWPLVLVLIGALLLGEWALDRDNPYGRRHSGIGLIIVILIISGLSATSSNRWNWGSLRDQFSDDDDASRFFHGPEHDSQATVSASLPANGSVQISSNVRGDITVGTSSDDQVRVIVHKRVYGGSDDEARRRAESFAPVISTSGTVTTVVLNGGDNEAGSMDITVPANAPVQVSSSHGDFSANGLRAGLTFTGHHGDVHIHDVTGNVALRNDSGDAELARVQGDVALNGAFDDVTIGDVQGSVTMDGEFTGDMNVRSVNGAVHFHSSRTDLTLRRLDGQLTLDSGDLRVAQAAGPLKLSTRGKDVDLNDVSADITVSNDSGTLDIVPAMPLGNITVDRAERISLSLPGSTGFQVQANAKDGTIESDFGQTTSGEDRNSLAFTNGDGKLKISLSSQGGDITLRRTTNLQTIPERAPESGVAPAPPTPPAPKLTKTPRVPRVPAPPAVPAPVNQ